MTSAVGLSERRYRSCARAETSDDGPAADHIAGVALLLGRAFPTGPKLPIGVRHHEVPEVAELDENPARRLVLIATRVSPFFTIARSAPIGTR